jgi:hypothetical protein
VIRLPTKSGFVLVFQDDGSLFFILLRGESVSIVVYSYFRFALVAFRERLECVVADEAVAMGIASPL